MCYWRALVLAHRSAIKCRSLTQGEIEMTTDSPRIMQRYFDEVWSTGDERTQAQLIAGMPVRQGREGHQAWVNPIRTTMPDLRYTIEDIVVGPRDSFMQQLQADG